MSMPIVEYHAADEIASIYELPYNTNDVNTNPLPTPPPTPTQEHLYHFMMTLKNESGLIPEHTLLFDYTGGPRYMRYFYLQIRVYAIEKCSPKMIIFDYFLYLPRICAIFNEKFKFFIKKLIIKINYFNAVLTPPLTIKFIFVN